MHLHVDPFCGAAGDMLLGAWVDLGVDFAELTARLDCLNVPGLLLQAQKESRCGIQGTRVIVTVEESHAHRGLADVSDIVNRADLSPRVKERATAVFRLIAEAEAQVHGRPVDSIHFHEVGAYDAVVDVVGSCLCMETLGWPIMTVGPLHVGSGTVRCRHGEYPVPAPATALLLRDVPVFSRGVQAELVTPTGAAILRVLADCFCDLPAMTMRRIGYGVGARDTKPWPNVVRVIDGELGPREAAPIVVMETNIDDMNPEHYAHLMDKLFAAGALDVALEPIQMKHNRPATRVSVLLPLGQEYVLADVILRETTSLGVRWHIAQRIVKERREVMVPTPWGDIQAKLTRWGDCVTVAPEYRACREVAERSGTPLHIIYEAVRQAGAFQS